MTTTTEPLTDLEKFWALLDRYPASITRYWNRQKRECDLELVQGNLHFKIRSYSRGELVVLQSLVSIWKGSGDMKHLRIDITDLAALSSDYREPLLSWLADPFWP